MSESNEIPEAELELIVQTISDFIDAAKILQPPVVNMTALMAALIEGCVSTMSECTDPDTSLWVLSQILMRLAPKCERGRVDILSPGCLGDIQ